MIDALFSSEGLLAVALLIQVSIQVEAFMNDGYSKDVLFNIGSIAVDMQMISMLNTVLAFLLSVPLLFGGKTEVKEVIRSAPVPKPVEPKVTKSAPVPAPTPAPAPVPTPAPKVTKPPQKKMTKITKPPAESKSAMLGNRTSSNVKTLDVIVVGCGMPKKGMGWYHLTQLLEMSNVNVRAVVEPFFMNTKLCPEQPEPFAHLVTQLKANGVPCVDSIKALPKFTKDTMCLIAGRTNDNPALFRSCVENGAKVIYLEKPGAPTVAELESMSDLAKEKGVKVYLGYNKNVTPYVQKALNKAKTVKDSHIVFCHNNSYKANELNECFSRNSEGMLKNMAIHELALLVSFFDITVDTIANFTVNKHKLFTEALTVWVPGTSMPDPKYITDFSRVGFTVTSKSGKTVSVMADRCGGNVSFASVKDGSGSEVERFDFPDAEMTKLVDKKCEEDPEMMPYFFVQSHDYLVLKETVVESALNGSQAKSVATIQIAIDALKLAEHFTEEVNKALK